MTKDQYGKWPIKPIDNLAYVWYTAMCCIGRKSKYIGEKMYRNVLLTDKEIAILKRVIGDTLSEKIDIPHNNLTIILNRLREIKPLITNNQFFNYGK